MADCCAELRAELAALRTEIAKIKPVNEKAIAAQVQAGIIPQLPGIVSPIILTNLNPFKARLGKVESLSGQALQNAKQSLERAYEASNAATKATASANNAAGKAASAIAQVAGLAAALAAAGISIATLKILGGRLDAQDKRVDSHDTALSKILGLLNPIKFKAENANQTAKDAQSVAKNAQNAIKDAQNTAKNAQNSAKDAIASATQAKKQANNILYEVRVGRTKLESQITQAKKQANDALYTANRANIKAEEALKKAGVPGLRGLQGIPGKDGKPGVAGKDGKPGVAGKDGKPGVAGKDGLPGKDGKPGVAGKDGLPGKDGKDGLPGRDGKPGERGERGFTGARGLTGSPGKDASEGTVDEQSKRLLAEINQKVSGIPPLIMNTPKPLTYDQTIQATATGVCKTTAPGGCMNKALNDTGKDIKDNANKNSGNILDAYNAGSNTAQMAILEDISNKLGPQLPGGISKFLSDFLVRFNKVADWLHLDRVLNILIWWQTLHNAYQLSNNLGQTLTGAISNVLSVVGIKNAEGNALDIGDIIGDTFDAIAKKSLGEATWGGMKVEWKRYNRIYQAGANILNSVQSIGQGVLGALNVIGNWNASIGNALRKWGTVGENAYNWMNPNVNFQNRFFIGLETATNVVSQVDQIASEVLSVQENVKQIGEQSKELQKSLGQSDDSSQSKVVPEAQKIKQQADASKIVSKGKEITEADKEADE